MPCLIFCAGLAASKVNEVVFLFDNFRIFSVALTLAFTVVFFLLQDYQADLNNSNGGKKAPEKRQKKKKRKKKKITKNLQTLCI